MKIGRYRQAPPDDRIGVTGPAGRTKKFYVSLHQALSHAQALATVAKDPIEFTITEYDDVLYRVERDEHGIIHTTSR